MPITISEIEKSKSRLQAFDEALDPQTLEVIEAIVASTVTKNDSSAKTVESIALRAQFEHGAQAVLAKIKQVLSLSRKKPDGSDVKEPIPWGGFVPEEP